MFPAKTFLAAHIGSLAKLVLFAMIPVASITAQVGRAGRIHFRIVSERGVEITEGTIRMTSIQTGSTMEVSHPRRMTTLSPTEREEVSPSPFTFEGISFGKYRVEVRAPMLLTRNEIREVDLNQPEQWATLVFPFSSPISRRRTPPAPEVSVKVHGRANREPLWIKIVGVYSNFVWETRSSADGKFLIKRPPEGRYLAIITIRSSISQVVRFELFDRDDHVDLLLPEDGDQQAK